MPATFPPVYQDRNIKSTLKLSVTTIQNLLLLSNPEKNSDRPGFYSTLQEASAAAKQLRITGEKEYGRLYKQDPRLPPNPRKTYQDWQGWKVFLEKKRVSKSACS